MAIDKLIPQYLNSDADQKLIKSVEMADALNVLVSNNDQGTAGVIKNVKGTEVVNPKLASDAFPAGENRTVGSVSNEKNKEIIFLVWNENNDHGIYRMDTTDGRYSKVFQDSVLNLSKLKHITCSVVVNENEDTLFYWTDNSNPPMKVNINRLTRGEYPNSLYNGTNEEKLLSLTVAKQPPLKAPSFNFINNPDIRKNNLYKKSFQFAYQYKYIDGELSALSPYSPVTASVTQLQDGLIENSTKEFYNQLNIFVRNTVADVKEIIVYSKSIVSDTFYEIAKIDNNETTNATTIAFTDDKISRALPIDAQNKTYDNVPQTAKAQAIVNNRLMYANYKEGYENTDVDAALDPVYHKVPEIYTITVSHEGTSDVVLESSNFPEFNIDFSEVPLTLTPNDRVFLEFSIVPDQLSVFESATNGFGDIIVNVLEPTNQNVEKITLNSSDGPKIKLSPQGISVSKLFSFTQSTSRAAFITTVSNFLVNNYHESVISAPYLDVDYSTFNKEVAAGNNNSAKTWYSGVSYFTFPTTSTTTTSLVINIRFSGAELFVKDLEMKHGNWFTEPFNGYKVVEVINSESLTIGGQAPFSKFPISASVLATSTATYRTTIVAGNASFGGKTTGSKTFKAGSDHSFGIVYMDDRGRTGGVNKLDDTFVKNVSDRDYKGRSEVDIRVKNTAPTWAKKWMPVYGGNASMTDYIQYTSGEAYANYDSQQLQGSTLGKRIYVSMSTLEGTETSFKEQTGADLEYKFNNGDTLRIIKYKDSAGTTVYPSDYVFDVVDYKYFSVDEARLFLNRTGNETAAGWFLILNSENHEGFDVNKVVANADLWSNETVIEIQKPAKEVTEKAYYGLGKTYDIVNGVHEGDRIVSSQPSATLVIDGVGGITSADRLYVGDTVDVSGTIITIQTVRVELNGTYSYTYKGVVSSTSGAFLIGNYQNGVATISQGDSYHRVRKIRLSDSYDYNELPKKLKENRFAYSGGYVEDLSISDFFSSKSYTKGKPYAHIPNAKTVHRRSSITYSDAFAVDTDVLAFSSFNLSLVNYKDLAIGYGNINSIINRGDSLTIIQESKASQVAVSRNVIQYASGDAGVSISTDVLGPETYYSGDFGTSNPESVIERFGVVYYVDVKAAKVIRLSADGITAISDKGVESYLETKFKNLGYVTNRVIAIGGFDPDNKEYLLTVEPVYNTDITVDSSVYTTPTGDDGAVLTNGIYYTSSTIIWNTWGNLWNTYCGNWEDVGNGVIFVDSMFAPQSVIVDASFIGSTATINILITNAAYGFSAIGTINLGTGEITFPAATCEGNSFTAGTPVQKEPGFTLAYKHNDKVWSSRYSFMPSMYVHVNNELYSFFNNSGGLMWKHNSNDTRNNFYGTQYQSVINVVSNENPSMVKIFKAVGLEGDVSASAVFKTSTQNTTNTFADFIEREGNQYAAIPRDSLNSTGHKIYLGKVAVLDPLKPGTVEFTTPINRIPFVVGDFLKTATGTTLNITGMTISGITDRKTIECTTSISNIVVGDDIYVEHNSLVDGDTMRGVHLGVELTLANTDAFELHAVSIHYDRSRLHNDRVN